MRKQLKEMRKEVGLRKIAKRRKLVASALVATLDLFRLGSVASTDPAPEKSSTDEELTGLKSNISDLEQQLSQAAKTSANILKKLI